MTEAKRSALVVASYEYQDARLRRLRAPARDAEELARVLSDESIGDFDVEVSVNEPEHVVRRKLAGFFQNRGLDDVLLLHLSCHGVKDDDGHLYFATADTEVSNLDATSIPSEFVNRQMTRSRSRRIVLLLDCCYSGAFASGMLSRAGDRVDLKERFDGRGRVVLTASSAMEYSFEGDELSGAANPSVFTSALVRGLESGGADRNRDGWISVDELYDFAYDEVRAVTPSQTPGKWTFDVQGELYLARSSMVPEERPVELPAELQSAAESPFAQVRLGAVQELIGVLGGSDKGLADAARAALERLVQDDSRRVSEAATHGLAGPSEIAAVPWEAPAVEAAPAAVSVPAPAAEAARVPAAARAPSFSWPIAAAMLGAALLLLAFLLRIPGDKSLLRYMDVVDRNLFLVYSPIEVIPVALGVAGVAVALLLGRIRSALGAGLLVGFGALATAAAVALLVFVSRYLDFNGLALVPLGAVLILAAGLLLFRSSSPVAANEGRVPPAAIWAGVAGTALSFVSLFFVNYKGESTLAGEALEFALEPFVALAAMVAALVLLSRLARPLFGAGLLVAIGAATALHSIGVVVGVSARDEVRAGGFVGLVGAALVAAAGLSVVLRAERARNPRPSRA